jgi:hypothetical protein
MDGRNAVAGTLEASRKFLDGVLRKFPHSLPDSTMGFVLGDESVRGSGMNPHPQ